MMRLSKVGKTKVFGSMLLHPFARPWGFPMIQTASQILMGVRAAYPEAKKNHVNINRN
jgi:hypothetical protein